MRVVNDAEKHVVVSDEALHSLREADADAELASVRYLNVMFNALENLEGIEKARSLLALNVSHNALKSLRETATLRHLHVLKCSFNEITELSWVKPLLDLRELWVNDNRIASPELQHLQALSSLRWLVIHPNPCTQSEDYAAAVVRHAPWLERVDSMAVDQELRDRAEQYEARAESVVDSTLHPSSGSTAGPESAAESPPSPPTPAVAVQAPKAKKKNFIPVENNTVSSGGGDGGEAVHPPPLVADPVVTEAVLESPEKAGHMENQVSPAKQSPRKELPAKSPTKSSAAATADGSTTDSEGGPSSILGAVLSLPTFGADSFLKKQPATKSHRARKPKTTPTMAVTDVEPDSNFEQEPVTLMYPNSTVAAVSIRSDGSAVAKWPSGSIAVSVDKEPGGFRIYAAHKDGTIALSFDPAGVGFINYYPSGRMLISTSSIGDGLYFSSDGLAILRQWDASGAMRDDKFEATDSLGDEPDGALLCRLSDALAVRVQLLPRQPVAPRNPIALRVFFATTAGIRRVFANRPNAAAATECEHECDAIFGEATGKNAAKVAPVSPAGGHSDPLGAIRAAVAGL